MTTVLPDQSALLEEATKAASIATFQGGNVPQINEMPERRKRKYTIISADDHLVEPPNLFDGRLSAKYGDRAPKLVDMDDGSQVWVLDGQVLSVIAINAVAGQKQDEDLVEPRHFADIREGAYDVHKRVEDMDLDGVYASLCFPSLVGFAGVRLQALPDQKYALDTVRAWNDWHIEEWVGPYPDRFIACQIPWLNDSKIAAEEIHRNAERGFKSVSFPELPGKLGFEPLASEAWDPFWKACEETDTVISVHTGSAGLPVNSEGTNAVGTQFGAGYSMIPATEWLYAKMALKYPNLKIVMTEGGIGWVAAVYDRLDHAESYRESRRVWDHDIRPSDVFRRNFWFCTLNDPSAMPMRHRIGLDKIMFEVDYPHADTSWPNTQARADSLLKDLPKDEADMIAWRNASQLYRHEVPAAIQRDPEAFGQR